MNEGEKESENAIGGVQTVNNSYQADSLYNPYPFQVYIHNNTFENSYWFPTLSNDFGKLFLMKSFMNPPDIAYDGIPDPARSNPQLCIQEGDDITLINLDAANDFKNLTKGAKQFDCEGKKIGM